MLIYEPQYKTLGQNIAFYRRRKELTQERLAEMVDINNVHMNRIERGVASASLDTLFAIAAALEVGPYKLFQEKD